MSAIAELRTRLDAYLGGSTTLTEFQEWFAPLQWETDADSDPAAPAVFEIGLRLAEFSGGAWTEPELRDLLRAASATGLQRIAS